MKKKKKKMPVAVIIILSVVALILAYTSVMTISMAIALPKAIERLKSYEAETVSLSYGNMTYCDKGEGDVVLSFHGIFGGYDQALDSAKEFIKGHRVIAPSRFGYLGSDVKGEGTPKEQAEAFVELLDKLDIDKVYLFATSAGGTPAIRFALDYPNRVKGIILYSSAMPMLSKPDKVGDYAGPPEFLLSDFGMYMISPLLEPMMGMEYETINSMLPVKERKKGIILDSKITNLDMQRNFDDYDIESITSNVIVFQAKDDKLANYNDTLNGIKRFSKHTFVSFDNGGHLLKGHEEEIDAAITKFFAEND